MKKIYGIYIVFALFLSPFYVYAEKQDAAVSPISVLGDIPVAERTLIFNRFENQLSEYYRLTSQEQFKRAEEQVFSSLELEQCTEGYCIRKIQELLQIERMFFLHITVVDAMIQLNVTLVRDEDKLVQESVCENCQLKDLYDNIGLLVKRIAMDDLGEGAMVVMTEEEASSLPWHITAIAVTVGSAWLAMDEAAKFDALAEENEEILERDRQATTSEELKNNKSIYESNQDKMNDHLANINMFNMITVLALAWEGYLIYSDIYGDDSDIDDSEALLYPDKFRISPLKAKRGSVQIDISWKW